MIWDEKTIWWEDGLCLIDQTRLPGELRPIKIGSIKDLIEAITSLRVRGAPALGAAGAYGIALAAQLASTENPCQLLQELEMAGELIKKSRPTAVNLSWGVDRVLRSVLIQDTAEGMRDAALRESELIAEEDIAINKALGKKGAILLDDGDRVLTHCNAGRLACVGWGTALGVVRSAVEAGKEIHVYACETRPLNQGSRLTAWELVHEGIDVTLICESASGSMMRKGRIDKAIVGADRIAKDAVFNKIGTYNHAVLAKAHKLPFYVAAPLSTFDLMHCEADITIEERGAQELCSVGGVQLAPARVNVYNPAFDATPLNLVTALITEKGIFKPPLMPQV
jgi:methylthioribose-1-phosphate isomerase